MRPVSCSTYMVHSSLEIIRRSLMRFAAPYLIKARVGVRDIVRARKVRVRDR